MGFIEWFARWLGASGPRATAPRPGDHEPIDAAALVAELELPAAARRLGAAGLPPPDATMLSGPETAALQRVEQRRQQQVDRALARLAVLNDDLRRGELGAEVQRARASAADFERRAQALLAGEEATLRTLGATARDRRDARDAFRARHGLAREARYPGGAGQALRLALLAFLVVVEGVLNAAFFARGLDTGLVGGAAYAMSLAALNVGLAYVLGRGPVRFLRHRSPGARAAGVMALLTALAVTTSVGLGIAHVRDALDAGAPNAGAAALAALQQAPFHLRDVSSWALFGLSVAFGLGALADGLSSDDPYPGYGAVDRRARVAIADHEEALDEVREALEDLKDEALRTLDDTGQRLQVSLNLAGASIEDKRAARLRLQAALRDADQALAAVLQAFRTENLMHRGNVPRPAYFDQMPELPPVALPDFDTAADEAALDRQRAGVEALRSEVEGLRAGIQAAATQAFERLAALGGEGAR